MKTKLIRLFVVLTLPVAPLASSAQTIVTNLFDSGSGTLRSAITNAANGAVITFDASLSGSTVTLSNTLTIKTNLTIDASALPGGLQINGNGSVQIFNVATNITVLLNSLTITNGYTTNNFYGDSTNNGAGIYNAGTLTLTNCTLSGNSVYNSFGGGIYNSGTVTMNQCTLSGNSAPLGGGIYTEDTLTMNQCTLFGNSATWGGGIENYLGTLTINRCTLSGNIASYGGGIHNNFASTLTLNQCTLSGSSAFRGGGVYNDNDAWLTLTDTIVAGNSGTDIIIINHTGLLNYGGSNLVQSVDNSGGMIIGPAPLTNAPDLAPLGNYGGPTQTMPPLPGSPAIGAGSVAANTFATDQRGYPRTQNGLIDIGAVELQPPAANPPVLTRPWRAANGTVAFGFTNVSNADFTVLATTNLALPLGQWSILGQAFQTMPGQYQFTDTAATNYPQQFYRAVSP
jgi:hypothetical protein